MLNNRLQLTKLLFTLRFVSDTRLSTFVGNTVRGALGRALSLQCCEWETPRCEACDNTSNCVYGSVFKVQSSESVPNPYVLSAPYPSMELYKSGDTLDFSVVLCGSSCVFEEDVLRAARSMCAGKLHTAELVGARREYSREWSDEGAMSIDPCDALTVRFVSPAEIRSGGNAVDDVDFAVFVDSLFRRIAGVIDNYTDSEFVLPYSLVERKPFIRYESDLKQLRFVTNDQPIDGLIGTIRYFGDVTRYLPYIDLGSQLHIGKKTTRGCGEYVFEL